MSGLMHKKLFGLPLPVVIALAVAGLAVGIYIRRRSTNASGSLATGSTASVDNTGTTSYPDIGTATAGGSASGSTPAGAQGIDPAQYVQDVLNAYQGGAQNVLGNFESGVALGQQFSSTSGGDGAGVAPSSVTIQPVPVNVTLAGGSAPHSTSTALAKAKAVSAPAAIRYYTLKSQVKLKAGQTLHFAKGKGYYAA